MSSQKSAGSTSSSGKIPNEHYIVEDPDNNSVFSAGGGKAGQLSTGSGNVGTSGSPSAGTYGWTGITGRDQASVNNGGDLEPPDQGLCTDGNDVMEYVNNALEVYSSSGSVLAGPIASPSIYGIDPNAFMSDPRCLYDPASKKWFLTEFVVGTTDENGAEASPSVQYIAVSNSSDPLGSYHVVSIDTTDPTTSGCPCFGDFDQIGTDANGFYLTTNEFGISSGAFNGSIIYAFDKRSLLQSGLGSSQPAAVMYRLISDAFTQPYHVSPATSAPGAGYAPNREYFVESNSDANADNHLIVYTLWNTQALTSGGTPVLTNQEIETEAYAFPGDANQKPGPRPLGSDVNEPEGQLQADFNAIQEVTYTGGNLYAEADTEANGRDAIAWWVLHMTPTGETSTATVAHQGYVTSKFLNLLYPDIAVNSSGNGYLVFSVSGQYRYPSAADMTFTPSGPTGPIHIEAAGATPEDGFTCYAAFVGPDYGGCRWGDYSMGVAAGSQIYMATEYVPPTPRDYYTNWGTFVWRVPAATS